jgi:hypothetical protein
MARTKAVRLGVIAACAGIIAAVVVTLVLRSTTHTVAQPKPTQHPETPGLSIAQENFDLPDPFILTVKRTYYLYLSTAFGNTTQNIPMFSGSPGHWSAHSIDAVPDLPSWAIPGLAWAPAVYKLGHQYVLYFSPSVAGTNPLQHCIGIGTAKTPKGPFSIRATPFVCQQTIGGDIDPQVFVDPHGPNGPHHPNYLVWKGDNNSTPGDGPTTIWSQALSNDGLTLEGKPVVLLHPTRRWEQPILEAPQMALSPTSTVWFFFSAGTGFFSPHYAMGAAKCAGPLGPCKDVLKHPLIASNEQGSGPGEETYFVAPDGSDWLLYSPVHTGFLPELFRPVTATRIGWGKKGPYVAEAGSFPPP